MARPRKDQQEPAAVERIKNDGFVGIFLPEIALHHRQFIQVSE